MSVKVSANPGLNSAGINNNTLRQRSSTTKNSLVDSVDGGSADSLKNNSINSKASVSPRSRPSGLSLLIRRIKLRLNTHHDKFKMHKIVGISCGLHYIYRLYVLIRYGRSFFGSEDTFTFLFTLFTLLWHMTLPITSLIFRVLKYRNPEYWLMIWTEYRLHVIIFTLRSVSVGLLSLFFGGIGTDVPFTSVVPDISGIANITGITNINMLPANVSYEYIQKSIEPTLNSVTGVIAATTGGMNEYLGNYNINNLVSGGIGGNNVNTDNNLIFDPFWLHLLKFLSVMLCHRTADYVTKHYGDPSVSTIRCHDASKKVQINWDEWLIKRFYVFSQFIAIGTLVYPHCGTTKSDLIATGIDIGFGELYPIHFAAFLMTLQKAGIIDYRHYTFGYTLCLFISFLYDSYHMPAIFLIGIFMVFLCRVHLRMNKYLLWTLFFVHCQFVKHRL